MTKRIPAEVFPVGEFIREEMEARNWDSNDLALKMGGCDYGDIAIDQLTVELLLAVDDPSCYLSDDTAEKLGRAFGVSGTVFLALDQAYRCHKRGEVIS